MRRCHPVLLAVCLLAATAGAQVTIAPGAGVFLDISTGAGTAIAGVGDDTAHAITTTIGNALLPAGPIVVTSNGFIVAGTTPLGSTFTNSAITATTTSSTAMFYPAGLAVLCPHWDDLYAVAATAATTIYWAEIAGTLYIQWNAIGHFATSPAAGGPAITFQVQVHAGGGCVGSTIDLIYPDTTFGGTQAANDNGASATVGYIGAMASNNVQYSFNTAGSIPDGTALVVSYAPLQHAWSSPLGAGSIQLDVCGGTPFGMEQLLVTLNAGAFPNGWLFGIDITTPELLGEYGAFPWLAPLNGSGAITLGPFGGLPSGLTLYSIVFDVPAGIPTAHTEALSYTIP